jgi:K+-transporting ATPase KdpF subunit
MNAEHWSGLVLAAALLAYLTYTLLRPEKF